MLHSIVSTLSSLLVSHLVRFLSIDSVTKKLKESSQLRMERFWKVHFVFSILSLLKDCLSFLIVVSQCICLFDIHTGNTFVLVHRLAISGGVHVNSVALNRSGEWIAFGSAMQGQLLVWEWQSETCTVEISHHHPFSMNSFPFFLRSSSLYF